MRSGRLRHRVRIERATETQNAFGEPVKGWSLLGEVWAGIEPLRGNERFQAQAVQSSEDVRIVMRFNPDLSDISTKDRVVFGAKVYDINAVLNIDERNREVHVMAKLHDAA